MGNNSELGEKIHRLLVDKGIETPFSGWQEGTGDVWDTTRDGYESILKALGLDLNDDSLTKTPERIAKMYKHELFWGLDYANFPDATTVDNKFGYDEMVAVEGIRVESLCEHHFLPFIGTATIAYIPSGKILGLSKFNRVVDFFAHRPQIQERLTEQVSAALSLILECDDVAVVIRADHYCVRLRGVRDGGSETVSSKLRGKFRDVPELRSEFLALTR